MKTVIMIYLKKRSRHVLQRLLCICHRIHSSRLCNVINVLFVIAVLQLFTAVIYLVKEEFNQEKHLPNVKRTWAILTTTLNSSEINNQWPSVYSGLNVNIKLMNTILGLRFVEEVSYGNRHGDRIQKDKNSPCPLLSPNTSRMKLNTSTEVSLKSLSEKLSYLEYGGYFCPTNCIPNYKVAVIVPYRGRFNQLGLFLQHIHTFLQAQLLSYRIIVVEMDKNITFNKGVIMNAAFLEASKREKYDCFIFHDVDLLPEDDRILYRCTDVSPRHLSVAVSTLKYKLLYNELFGGVTAMTSEQLMKTNGYSNKFFGWGGEDDDMFNRIVANSMTLSRYSVSIARFTMLKHKKNEHVNTARFSLLDAGLHRWQSDGLNSLKYDIVKQQFTKLYTYYLVSIDEADDIFQPLVNFTTTVEPPPLNQTLYNYTLEEELAIKEINFTHSDLQKLTETDNKETIYNTNAKSKVHDEYRIQVKSSNVVNNRSPVLTTQQQGAEKHKNHGNIVSMFGYRNPSSKGHYVTKLKKKSILDIFNNIRYKN